MRNPTSRNGTKSCPMMSTQFSMKSTTFSKRMPRNSSVDMSKKAGNDLGSAHSKECSDCHEIKPLEAFHRNKKGPLGRAYVCKDCVHRRYEFRRNRVGPDPRRRRVVPDGHKWCPGCESMLPESEFGRNASAKDGLTGYCRPCHNRIGRENRIRLVGSTRNFHLKRRYGLTED